MREQVRAFVEMAAKSLDLVGPIYEFGSYLVEGQEELADLRPCFPGQEYIGCDMRPGPGVDRVEDVSALRLPAGCAQTIICVDTLEHVFEARRAAEEMLRVLAPGGVMLLAAPMDFRLHDYPSDYWRLTPSCLSRLLEPLPLTVVGSQGVESYPHTVYGLGCKGPLTEKRMLGVRQFLQAFPGRLERLSIETRRARRWRRRMVSWLRSKGERRRERDYFASRFWLHLSASAADCEWSVGEQQGLGSRVDLITGGWSHETA